MNTIIGLTGDICAGKSFVSKHLEALGAIIWDADKEVHLLYEREDVKADVMKLFGADVFNDDWTVNRKAIARIVFHENSKKLEQLSDIIKPRLELDDLITRFRNNTNNEVLVLDAPTLFESGYDTVCDRIMYVTALLRTRIDWSIKNRGWNEYEITNRECRLWPASMKKARSTVVVENNGTQEDLKKFIDTVWIDWRRS